MAPLPQRAPLVNTHQYRTPHFRKVLLQHARRLQYLVAAPGPKLSQTHGELAFLIFVRMILVEIGDDVAVLGFPFLGTRRPQESAVTWQRSPSHFCEDDPRRNRW